MLKIQTEAKAPRLLHGTLVAKIFKIDHLQDGWDLNSCLTGCNEPVGCAKRQLKKVKRLVLCRPEVVSSRLYATVDFDRARVARTRTLKHGPHPKWDESFRIYCAHTITDIVFTVKYDNPVGATLIGRAYVPVQEVLKGYIVSKWVRLEDEERQPIPGGSRIKIYLQFTDIKHESRLYKRIGSPSYEGIHAFFKERRGCRVTLYQDAHCPSNVILPFRQEGKDYEAHRCWKDVFDAISNAKHLIYIAGWSVYPQITLVRDPINDETHLGELLKRKADEGVRVLMLIWDDRTSVPQLREDGLMGTHDEETFNYFKDTNVHCVLCPRYPYDGRSVVEGIRNPAIFTHHQKTVVVDYKTPDDIAGKRRIMSFVGGLDLCDGRYDTPEHYLFKTLDGAHRDDFHQPNFPGSSIKKGGPREPWHDIHCRLEGPVAWDVLYNFEQRWNKQAGREKDLLVPIHELQRYTIQPSEVMQPSDPNTWNVQVLRSIDNGAVVDFPTTPSDAEVVGLVSGKDDIIDRSIQDAYINAIRQAKNFIYIENQYFLGSSYAWKPDDSKPINIPDINALHLIPRELSLKIVSKIEAGERFVVYVLIPMWPEGIPESGSVQAILDWQRRTMEMMYSDIAAAIQRKGLNRHPRDYLTFFCLGKKESKSANEFVPPEKPDPNTNYYRAQQSRRFMIYVHAKMMIVDDEYIILGSANINQRSMDGTRDTEIAMGAYQPHHLSTEQKPAMGQIHGFRLALWYEHLRTVDNSFDQPESLQCVQYINEIAKTNWHRYVSDGPHRDSEGHLLSYPIQVDKSTGSITNLPGIENFPDTESPILGSVSSVLAPILTT